MGSGICVINESDFEDLLVIIKNQATSLELQVLEKKRPQITPVDIGSIVADTGLYNRSQLTLLQPTLIA